MGSRRYRVLVGFNYRAGDREVRHEPDELVDDLPAGVVEVLAQVGAIWPVDGEDVRPAESSGQEKE